MYKDTYPGHNPKEKRMQEFLSKISMAALPVSSDDHQAKIGMERFTDATQSNEELNRFVSDFARDKNGQKFLSGIFGNSPYLTGLMIREPCIFHDIVTKGLAHQSKKILDHLKSLVLSDLEEAQLMKELRIAKRRMALTTALGDITGIWSLKEVTHSLSDLADACLDACVAHILGKLAANGDIAPLPKGSPCPDSGFVILGMGKHGSQELNYSSDIDLVFLSDGDGKTDGPRPVTNQEYFDRLADYKRPGADFEHLRPVYGFIPARHHTTGAPQERARSARGLLSVGDAAARQNPLTFTGFGAFVPSCSLMASVSLFRDERDRSEPRSAARRSHRARRKNFAVPYATR